jgi:hypothetical protein
MIARLNKESPLGRPQIPELLLKQIANERHIPIERAVRLTACARAAAVDSDESVVGNSEVKKLEDRVRRLERMLNRKTMKVEILREALSKADAKNGYRARSCCRRTVPDEGRRRHAGRLPIKPLRAVERQSKAARAYHKTKDAELLPIISRLVDQRPTYGYQRIAALLNRETRAADKHVVDAKRVHSIMSNHAMLLEKHTAVRNVASKTAKLW